MALCVVDLFEAVDVDEREHERGARPVCTLELARHLLEAERARPRARQFVRRRELQVVCRFGAQPERLGTFAGCLSLGRRPPGHGRRLPWPGRPPPAPDPLRPPGECPPGSRSRPASDRAGEPSHRGPPRHCREARQPDHDPLSFAALPWHSRRATPTRRHGHGSTARAPGAPEMGGLVAAGREIIVGSVLILVRARWSLTRLLVAIRRRLVAVRERLFPIARSAVGDPLGRGAEQVAATRWAGRGSPSSHRSSDTS